MNLDFRCGYKSKNDGDKLLPRSLVMELFEATSCPGRGGGTPHMKGLGMLVVSLRGINFGFWSHLGCSGQNAIIFSREGLV